MRAISHLIAFFAAVGTGGPALAALAGDRCAEMAAAHAELLAGSFTVERRFEAEINGEWKKRERVRLDYAAGEISVEVLETESRDSMVRIEGAGDAALEIPFACEWASLGEDGELILTSPDGLEQTTFVFGPEGALELAAWRFAETKRLLFKKFALEARAEYGGFARR